MGLNGLADICRQMVAHGAPPGLNVAVVQDGSIASQKVVTGTLSDIADKVARAGLRSPSLTIIGAVVSLHETLAWFQPAPVDALA